MGKLFVGIALICFITTSTFAGGGWTQSKGNGFFMLKQRILRSNLLFSNDGSTDTIPTTGFYFTSLYMEYGISDKFELMVNAPFFTRIAKNAIEYSSGLRIEGDEENNIGDLQVGLKYGLINKEKLKLAGSVIFGVPTGTTSGGNDSILQTGDGEFNQMVKLEASRSINRLYGTVSLAFNNRTNGFSEELYYGFEVGYSFEKFILNMKYNGLSSLFNGDVDAGDAGLFSNNVEFQSLGFEGAYKFSDTVGGVLGIGLALAGKNIIASPAYNIGLYWKLVK